MAQGDQADFVSRLRAILPDQWFPDAAPILSGVLNGLASILSYVFGLIAYARTQSRIATATDGWLDMISRDFFAFAMPRRVSEGDASFRARIFARMFRPAGTRAAVILGLQTLTGRTPIIIEPWRTTDCGAWDGTGGIFAYDTAGYWGDLSIPWQMFVQAFRPNTGGISTVMGWDGTTGAAATGGWDTGAIEWTDPTLNPGQVQDADIYQTIVDLMPAGTIGWTAITS